MSLVPFTAKDCVVCIYYYYVKRQVVNYALKRETNGSLQPLVYFLKLKRFLVVLINSQLVCLPPVGIFKPVMFI